MELFTAPTRGGHGERFAVIRAPARFEQEPVPFLRAVDEGFEHRRRADVVMLVGDPMRLAPRRHVALLSFISFAQHVARGNGTPDYCPLMRCKRWISGDRADRGAAELAHAFSSFVGGVEQLFGRLVEQQKMITAESCGLADMSMEILGFEIECIGVGKQAIQRLGNRGDRASRERSVGVSRGAPVLLHAMNLLIFAMTPF